MDATQAKYDDCIIQNAMDMDLYESGGYRIRFFNVVTGRSKHWVAAETRPNRMG